MTQERLVNVPASVHQRLLNWSVQHGEPPHSVFTRYVLERFLFRLSKSPFADQFVLKGAMLFLVWAKSLHRPTRDLDLLAFGTPSEERVREIFRRICGTDVEPDGLTFDADSLQVSPVREDQRYLGHRVKLLARLGNARIPMQVDIGFGDAVVPAAQMIEYPTLLRFPPPHLRAYRRETMVAEKLEAMIVLGIANRRMKDFYDLFVLSEQFPFQGPPLAGAIRATLRRRDTVVTDSLPLALTDLFARDPVKVTQWNGFVKRSRLPGHLTDFPLVLGKLRAFLAPPLQAVARGEEFERAWPAGGPWA